MPPLAPGISATDPERSIMSGEPRRLPAVRRGELAEHFHQLAPVSRADPAAVDAAEVEAPGAARHPDLLRGGVAVDDQLRAAVELDLEHALALEAGVAVDAGIVERLRHARERRFGEPVEFALVHAC